MSSDEENLFGDEAHEVSCSDDDGRPAREQSEDERNGRNTGSGDDEKEEEKKVKTKLKRQSKRLILGEDTLCGNNGLVKIEEIFKDFKFQPRGKEKQDLDRILYKLEHWVHVLHPRYPFEQTLERIEWLGLKKKSVKTYVKKIRLGLLSNFDSVDINIQDFGNSDNEVDKDAPTKAADVGSEDNESLPIQIQRFGLDSSEDEDDWIFASIADETISTTVIDSSITTHDPVSISTPISTDTGDPVSVSTPTDPDDPGTTKTDIGMDKGDHEGDNSSPTIQIDDVNMDSDNGYSGF